MQQSVLIQEIARQLGYNQNQVLAIMEEGLTFNYQEKFEEQKQIYPNFDKELVESLENKLNKIKFEEIPKKYELAYKIKDEEDAYKTELEQLRLKREQGGDHNKDYLDLEEKDDYTLQKEKQKKKKFKEEKYKRIEADNKKKKEYMLKHNLSNYVTMEDYLIDDEDLCEDYEDFYDLYENEDYDEDENYYDFENNVKLITEDNEYNYDEKKQMNLELATDKFIVKKDDFINVNSFINDLVNELYCLETQPNYNNEKKIERIISEKNHNLYFAEYGSKYKSLIFTDETDFINLNINDKELYDFFSKYINKEQIIEIFELIY